jgi:hypothetical protein
MSGIVAIAIDSGLGRKRPFQQRACQIAWGTFEVGRRGRVPGFPALHLVSSTVSLAASRPDENTDTMPMHKPHRTTVGAGVSSADLRHSTSGPAVRRDNAVDAMRLHVADHFDPKTYETR